MGVCSVHQFPIFENYLGMKEEGLEIYHKSYTWTRCIQILLDYTLLWSQYFSNTLEEINFA